MHQFHIPVLGLGFSIDTPLKVARYGISSAVSIVDDELVERMREYHCRQNHMPYRAIPKNSADSRARRITSYLNLLNVLVELQFEELKNQEFYTGSDLDKYFELLPDDSQLKQGYELMRDFNDGPQRLIFENILRSRMNVGTIDVNIMTKVDKVNLDSDGNYTGDTNTDALAALRGFAESDLRSSLVLSAGLNQRLFSYLESFKDFYPDAEGLIKKKIILKVSDFRSALLQAKLLAKKGLWVAEFRIESGLNCGGHAFATDGLLLGPILEEFKQKRQDLRDELLNICKEALIAKDIFLLQALEQRITAQGGIGTAAEQHFLMRHYELDGTGWGSPFLLVPEVTNVDNGTLQHLATADEDDFYLSNASPLGVLFNNFRHSTSEQQRLTRLAKGRPGSPCTKKLLVNNLEFTDTPICTASRQYQALKIAQLKGMELQEDELDRRVKSVTEKVCLCEGLCASAYIKNDMLKAREDRAVAICPGPNLAFFSGVYSLREMTDHIYGKLDLLREVVRPHLFINELRLYIDYFKKLSDNALAATDTKQLKYIQKFKDQLTEGVNYYNQLFTELSGVATCEINKIIEELGNTQYTLAGHTE